MLIGVTGYANSGKDSIGQVLVEDYGFQRVAFADKVRAFARAIDPIVVHGPFGDVSYTRLTDILTFHHVARDDNTSAGWYEVKKIPEVRRLLQSIGTEGGRNVLFDDVWVEATLRQIGSDDVVITDARFVNEFKAIEDAGGIMIRVYRPDTGPLNDHPSETELDQCVPYISINNDTTLERLSERVHYAMDDVIIPDIGET